MTCEPFLSWYILQMIPPRMLAGSAQPDKDSVTYNDKKEVVAVFLRQDVYKLVTSEPGKKPAHWPK